MKDKSPVVRQDPTKKHIKHKSDFNLESIASNPKPLEQLQDQTIQQQSKKQINPKSLSPVNYRHSFGFTPPSSTSQNQHFQFPNMKNSKGNNFKGKKQQTTYKCSNVSPKNFVLENVKSITTNEKPDIGMDNLPYKKKNSLAGALAKNSQQINMECFEKFYCQTPLAGGGGFGRNEHKNSLNNNKIKQNLFSNKNSNLMNQSPNNIDKSGNNRQLRHSLPVSIKDISIKKIMDSGDGKIDQDIRNPKYNCDELDLETSLDQFHRIAKLNRDKQLALQGNINKSKKTSIKDDKIDSNNAGALTLSLQGLEDNKEQKIKYFVHQNYERGQKSKIKDKNTGSPLNKRVKGGSISTNHILSKSKSKTKSNINKSKSIPDKSNIIDKETSTNIEPERKDSEPQILSIQILPIQQQSALPCDENSNKKSEPKAGNQVQVSPQQTSTTNKNRCKDKQPTKKNEPSGTNKEVRSESTKLTQKNIFPKNPQPENNTPIRNRIKKRKLSPQNQKIAKRYSADNIQPDKSPKDKILQKEIGENHLEEESSIIPQDKPAPISDIDNQVLLLSKSCIVEGEKFPDKNRRSQKLLLDDKNSSQLVHSSQDKDLRDSGLEMFMNKVVATKSPTSNKYQKLKPRNSSTKSYKCSDLNDIKKQSGIGTPNINEIIPELKNSGIQSGGCLGNGHKRKSSLSSPNNIKGAGVLTNANCRGFNNDFMLDQKESKDIYMMKISIKDKVSTAFQQHPLKNEQGQLIDNKVTAVQDLEIDQPIGQAPNTVTPANVCRNENSQLASHISNLKVEEKEILSEKFKRIDFLEIEGLILDKDRENAKLMDSLSVSQQQVKKQEQILISYNHQEMISTEKSQQYQDQDQDQINKPIDDDINELEKQLLELNKQNNQLQKKSLLEYINTKKQSIDFNNFDPILQGNHFELLNQQAIKNIAKRKVELTNLIFSPTNKFNRGNTNKFNKGNTNKNQRDSGVQQPASLSNTQLEQIVAGVEDLDSEKTQLFDDVNHQPGLASDIGLCESYEVQDSLQATLLPEENQKVISDVKQVELIDNDICTIDIIR